MLSLYNPQADSCTNHKYQEGVQQIREPYKHETSENNNAEMHRQIIHISIQDQCSAM